MVTLAKNLISAMTARAVAFNEEEEEEETDEKCPPTEANGNDSGENEDVSAYRSKWR